MEKCIRMTTEEVSLSLPLLKILTNLEDESLLVYDTDLIRVAGEIEEDGNI